MGDGMKSFYAVEIVIDGKAEMSRSFFTINAARKWAKFLSTASYISSVRIMKGGPGGMQVF